MTLAVAACTLAFFTDGNFWLTLLSDVLIGAAAFCFGAHFQEHSTCACPEESEVNVMIPDEAIAAAASALYLAENEGRSACPFAELPDVEVVARKDHARIALDAAAPHMPRALPKKVAVEAGEYSILDEEASRKRSKDSYWWAILNR